MKKLFALPVIGLILGAVAIATEIKTNDVLPASQQLSGAVVTCIKTALETKETALISAFTIYQNGALDALNTRKTTLLAAWDKTSKKEIKTTISTVWKTYKTSLTSLKSALSTATKNAWSTYQTEVKTCK
ncbi:TPA: hypothetical protein DCZ39_01610 [Patescibacteria group bacterium]|nr:hypothetical protein [Candidatus Gracilibacteria bacterium]